MFIGLLPSEAMLIYRPAAAPVGKEVLGYDDGLVSGLIPAHTCYTYCTQRRYIARQFCTVGPHVYLYMCLRCRRYPIET
jgi:hypothetical protein